MRVQKGGEPGKYVLLRQGDIGVHEGQHIDIGAGNIMDEAVPCPRLAALGQIEHLDHGGIGKGRHRVPRRRRCLVTAAIGQHDDPTE